MQKKWTALAVVGAVIFLAYIIYSSMGQTEVSCEVCMTFRGKSQCRTARGATPEEARRTATDVACTFISSGMADSIVCQNTPPARVMCSR